MQPRFVKQIVKNGEVIYDNPPKVLKRAYSKGKYDKTDYPNIDGGSIRRFG